MEAGRIDRRDRTAIREQIRRLAESYTPEWRFDTKNPDAGSVIGLIFADQMADNIRKLNRLPEKYHTEFANMYGAAIKAAKPSNCVVALKQGAGGYAGVFLNKGTQVLGETSDGEEIIFEFLHDVYVSNVRLCEALSVSGARNKVIPVYNRKKANNMRMHLFSFEQEGIGRQALYFYHPYLFDTQDKTVRMKLTGTKAIAELLADRGKFCFSYFSTEGYVPFDQCICEGDEISLFRSGEEVKQKADGQEMSVIRLALTGALTRNLLLRSVEILAAEQTGKPDFIYNGKEELQTERFLPFGEQMSSYQECFIGQKYLFRQRGMCLTLSFDLSFGTYREKDAGIRKPDLRIIKRKPRVNHAEIAYECHIQEIAFEYYNGRGWKKLACDADIEHLFADEANAGKHEISFDIPYDWEPVAQGGYEQECIRLLAVRADHCYLPNVEYRYPILSGLSMRASYTAAGRERRVRPWRVERERYENREDITASFALGEDITVFFGPAYAGDYAFFGFDRKFEQGPICFFFKTDKEGYGRKRELAFAYSAENGFKPLKVIDGTDGLQHSGTLLFMPPVDMAKKTVEGIERYWFRIEDTKKYFSAHPAAAPVVKQFYGNAVSVQNVVTLEEQDYYIEQPKADMRFPLYTENILRAEVWVNEMDCLSDAEMDAMLLDMPQQVRSECNFLGEREEFYVLWKETEDFDDAPGDGRCYRLDRGTGEIVFGDGIQVRIPQNTKSAAFKIRPVCCDGSRGNIGPGAIHTFRGSVPFVDEITNPIAAFGGSDMEDLNGALKRSGNLLASRRRLVSETDYIREIMFFSDTIAQASCVCEKDQISLVLLMRDYKNGSYAFRKIKADLKQYLLMHCEMTFREEDIRIVEPVFVRISVQLWLTVPDMTKSLEVRQYLRERLEAYFEPVTGKEEAKWSIGKLPKEQQIRLRLGAMGQEARLDLMSVIASYEDETGAHETELGQLRESPYMICCNGRHSIHLCEERRFIC